VHVVLVLQRTLVIASDMLLIGITDSEFVSRLGEFCLSLLQQGTSVTSGLLSYW